VVGTVTANATIPNATELVTGQNPDAYTPNVKGSAVDLTTSPFLPEKTRVPWLVGQERGPAESRLTALGLRPVIGNEPHLKPGQRHRVAWQFPPPNALVPPGSNVTLNLVASWF
jgi:beta-lactam-binding protein with PASTA domain